MPIIALVKSMEHRQRSTNMHSVTRSVNSTAGSGLPQQQPRRPGNNTQSHVISGNASTTAVSGSPLSRTIGSNGGQPTASRGATSAATTTKRPTTNNSTATVTKKPLNAAGKVNPQQVATGSQPNRPAPARGPSSTTGPGDGDLDIELPNLADVYWDNYDNIMIYFLTDKKDNDYLFDNTGYMRGDIHGNCGGAHRAVLCKFIEAWRKGKKVSESFKL